MGSTLKPSAAGRQHFDARTKQSLRPDCNTPVAFIQLTGASHLSASEESILSNGDYSLSVSACEKSATFDDPVVLRFNKSLVTKSGKEAYCSFFHPTAKRWIRASTRTSDSEIICEVKHLTYFTLLFKDTLENDEALSITDKVLTITSILFSMLVFLYYTRNYGIIRLQKQPVRRASLYLAISLFFMNIVFLLGSQFLNPVPSDSVDKQLNECVSIASTLFFTISAFLLTTLWMCHSMFAHHAKTLQLSSKIHTKMMILIELVLPYLISGVFVGIAVGVSYSLGTGFFYGGEQNLSSFLYMRTLNTGGTICFVQGYSFWLGIILPYGVTMLSVILCYIYLFYKIYTYQEDELNKVQRLKQDCKKMFVLFFTIGVCWLLMVFSIRLELGKWSDWCFIFAKAGQMFVIAFTTYWHRISGWFRPGDTAGTRWAKL